MSTEWYRGTLSQRPRDPREECGLLRGALSHALRSQKTEAAAALLERLEIADPDEPRWADQHGAVLVQLGDGDGARTAFQRAAELYASRGLSARRDALLQRASTLALVGA